jgi:predicted nucleic acid-binding protein
MAAKRTHILIPESLVRAIDELVGKRGRSAFIAEAAAREVERRQLLEAIEQATGAWKDTRQLVHGKTPGILNSKMVRRHGSADSVTRTKSVTRGAVASFLVDTSVLIDVLNGKRGRDRSLLELVRQGHMLASCAVTVAEVYAGMRPEEAGQTQALLSRLRYYEITSEVSQQAGRLKYHWARKGHTLSLADVLIAATALNYGLALITDNVQHFPMPELSIHNEPGRVQ